MIRPLEFQTKSLSIADICGRAARWIRPNVKMLFACLLVPEIVYHASWEAYSWILEKHGIEVTTTYLGAILVAVLLTLIFVMYELGARCVALWFCMAGKESSFPLALRRARTGRLLLVFLPTIVNELVVVVPISFVLLVANEINRMGQRTHGIGFDLFILYGFLALLLWTLPFKMICVANLAAAFPILAREESLRKGITKDFYFMSRAPITVLYAVIMISTISCLLELPAMLALAAEGLIKTFIPLDKTILEWSTVSVRVVINSAITMLVLAFEVASIALLDQELRNRLEGEDIRQDLERLRV